jgi:serine/threonine protein kinase
VFSFILDNVYCLAMELMSGGDLMHLLELEVRLDQDVAEFYLAEILEGL